MENKKTTRPPRRKRTIIILGILFAAGVIVALFFLVILPRITKHASSAESVTSFERRSTLAQDASALAHNQVGSGDVDGAITTLTAVIAQRQGHKTDLLSLYRDRGDIQAGAGRTAAAVESYDAAIALDPDNYVTYEGLGTVYEVANQKDNARTAYQKALEIAKKRPADSHYGGLTAVDEAQGFINRLDSDK